MRNAFLVAAIAATLAGCTVSKQDSMAMLEGDGYKDITLKGYPILNRCGENYEFRRKFKATNQANRKVKGVVCKGWVKGGVVKVTGAQ